VSPRGIIEAPRRRTYMGLETHYTPDMGMSAPSEHMGLGGSRESLTIFTSPHFKFRHDLN